MKKQIIPHSFDALSFCLQPVVAPAKRVRADPQPGGQVPDTPEVAIPLNARPWESASDPGASPEAKAGPHAKLLLVLVLVTFLVAPAHADDASPAGAITPPSSTYASANDYSGKFGAGLILGEPTGVSLKYFFNETIAIDGGIGWSFDDETSLHLHSDILWHKFDLVTLSEGQLPFYIGAGVRVKFRDNAEDRIGLRLPIGVSYIFEDLPLDIFFEVAPVIDFTPSTRGGFTAGIGARWWF